MHRLQSSYQFSSYILTNFHYNYIEYSTTYIHFKYWLSAWLTAIVSSKYYCDPWPVHLDIRCRHCSYCSLFMHHMVTSVHLLKLKHKSYILKHCNGDENIFKIKNLFDFRFIYVNFTPTTNLICR